MYRNILVISDNLLLCKSFFEIVQKHNFTDTHFKLAISPFSNINHFKSQLDVEINVLNLKKQEDVESIILTYDIVF